MAEPTDPPFHTRLADPVLFAAIAVFAALFAAKGIAILAVLACILVWMVHGRGIRDVLRRPNFAMIALILLMIWAGVTTVWSIAPELTIDRTVRIAIVAFLGATAVLLLFRADGVPVPHWAAWLLLGVVTCFLVFDAASGWRFHWNVFGPTDPYDRLFSVLAILMWPIMASIRVRFGRMEALIWSGVVLALIALSSNAAAGLAVLAGLVLFGTAALSHLLARITLFALLAVLALAVPALVHFAGESLLELVKTSLGNAPGFEHRMAIWQFTLEQWMAAPVQGWGAGVARAIPGGEEILVFRGVESGTAGTGNLMPLHPHNGFLQVLLETGAVGLGLIVAFIALVIHQAVRGEDDGIYVPAIAAALASALVIGATKFGAWQGWWLGVLVVSAMVLATCRAPRPEKASLGSIFDHAEMAGEDETVPHPPLAPNDADPSDAPQEWLLDPDPMRDGDDRDRRDDEEDDDGGIDFHPSIGPDPDAEPRR